MNTHTLLAAAVFATSIGTAMPGVSGDMKVRQPIISAEIRVPFLHGLPFSQVGGQTELASLEHADEWLN